MADKNTETDLVRFFDWRDNVHRRLVSSHDEDIEHADSFVARAQELVEEIEFLIQNGLNEGAMESLSNLAEQDMADFCIMVDLANDVEIAGVRKLDEENRLHLAEFLDSEPWHSLMVDNDLTVTLAMVEQASQDAGGRPWYETSPNLSRITARVLDQVNAEQLKRFVGELNAQVQNHGLRIPADVAEILGFVVSTAARRLGIEPPQIVDRR